MRAHIYKLCQVIERAVFPWHLLYLLRRSAYRQAARIHHPDKGGDPAAFARVQQAFQVGNYLWLLPGRYVSFHAVKSCRNH